MFGVQRIGRYEVLNHLASGGMGQVYLARATGLGGFERQVVVKTLDLSVTDDDEATFVTMFLDEARLVGALNHQYIAPVYEVGCDEEGHYYLVMDYVHGETAEAVFRVSGERVFPLPLGFSLTVVSCVASALDYAHGLCAADGSPLDIVHRDVSLSNVMCGHDGAVKLIDFGIAKAANRATKTQVGTLKGKIGYLAPEQILRKPVDHRADIFALGIVLYELTTATRAFRDNSDLITLERITNGEVRRPSEFIAGYPRELERIVMKALEVDPDRRFQDAGAMGKALEAFAAQMAIPLGHAAVSDVMSRLFSEKRGRRRVARGSSEVKTDPSITTALPITDEKTPITDIETFETETRNVALSRAQRPTTPIVEKKPTPRDVPLEDQPTPIHDPAARMRAHHALIPLEDRPTPMAEPAALPMPPERPTPPQRKTPVPTLARGTEKQRATPVPALARGTEEIERIRQTQLGTGPERPPRIPTGPQLPMHLEDAPTQIAATITEREDPTDVSGEHPVVAEPRRTGTAMVVRPPRDPQTRTWLMLCGLFALAVVVACIVAML